MSELHEVHCDHCNANISVACPEQQLRVRLIEEGRSNAIAPINHEFPTHIMNFCNKDHLKEWINQ